MPKIGDQVVTYHGHIGILESISAGGGVVYVAKDDHYIVVANIATLRLVKNG